MERKLLYIINPISGTSNKQSLKEIIAAETRTAGIPFEMFPSVASGDYSFIEQEHKEKKFTEIIIVGGDGTINQVIGSMKHLNLPFGIIPSGSGNGLGFGAGLPKNTKKALAIIFKGKAKWTDAFLINGRFACMLCGLGFDAQVAHDFSRSGQRGLINYIKKTLTNFISATTYPFTIYTQGKEIKTEAFFINIANSNQFGNNFTIAPKASLTDGLLDIVIMTRQNKLSVLMQAIKQISGYNDLQSLNVLDGKAHILYFQTDEIKISNPKNALLHIDGDPAETSKHIEVQLLKKSFRLIYP